MDPKEQIDEVSTVIITGSEDDSDVVELTHNQNFINAMSKIAQGLKESKIDWGKVKKVVLK